MKTDSLTQAARDGDAVLNCMDASQTVLARGHPEVADNVRAPNNRLRHEDDGHRHGDEPTPEADGVTARAGRRFLGLACDPRNPAGAAPTPRFQNTSSPVGT